MTPTEEQRNILSHANTPSNLMIFAYAGTGKTTTLTLLANEIDSSIPGLALAFNVKIKEELSKRFPKNFTVMTLNGLGHSAWKRTIGRNPILRDDKLTTLLQEKAKNLPIGEDFVPIRELVERAMRAGIIPQKYSSSYKGLGPDSFEHWQFLNEDLLKDEWIDLARQILEENVTQALQGIISFSDQLYMPTLFGGIFPKFPIVMVDEAQDLSALQHLMVKKCASQRLIVVGDPCQSIYQWRGAETNSMEKMKDLRPS